MCGSTEDLQLDHVDPSTKVFILSGCHLDKAWTRILEEAEKCQVLCETHHKEKSSKEAFAKVKHGSEQMYAKYGCRCDQCTVGYASKRKRYPSRSPVAKR